MEIYTVLSYKKASLVIWSSEGSAAIFSPSCLREVTSAGDSTNERFRINCHGRCSQTRGTFIHNARLLNTLEREVRVSGLRHSS